MKTKITDQLWKPIALWFSGFKLTSPEDQILDNMREIAKSLEEEQEKDLRALNYVLNRKYHHGTLNNSHPEEFWDDVNAWVQDCMEGYQEYLDDEEMAFEELREKRILEQKNAHKIFLKNKKTWENKSPSHIQYEKLFAQGDSPSEVSAILDLALKDYIQTAPESEKFEYNKHQKKRSRV